MKRLLGLEDPHHRRLVASTAAAITNQEAILLNSRKATGSPATARLSQATDNHHKDMASSLSTDTANPRRKDRHHRMGSRRHNSRVVIPLSRDTASLLLRADTKSDVLQG
jgi:hypothetical protein